MKAQKHCKRPSRGATKQEIIDYTNARRNNAYWRDRPRQVTGIPFG